MTSVISCTLVVALATGVVPLAGVSYSEGSLPAYQLTGVIGPPASYQPYTPPEPPVVYDLYLPVVIRQ